VLSFNLKGGNARFPPADAHGQKWWRHFFEEFWQNAQSLKSLCRTSSLESRSRSFWWSLGLGLVSKFLPGLGLGLEGYGLDCITGLDPKQLSRTKFSQPTLLDPKCTPAKRPKLTLSSSIPAVGEAQIRIESAGLDAVWIFSHLRQIC